MKQTRSWLSVLILFVAAMLLTPSDGFAAARHTVSITEMQYAPALLEIRKGDVVVWQNRDDRDHTAVADDKSFDSGNIKSGASFSHTFTKTGTFNYGCQYHPRMRGTVIVRE